MPPFPGPPVAQPDVNGAIPVVSTGVPGGRAGTPNGFQTIAVLTAAVAPTIPADTTYAIVTPTGQAVRWRDDGVAPTATVGMPIAVGAVQQFSGASLAAVKFIEQAASAALNISYYK